MTDRPFDVSVKGLVEEGPAGWALLRGPRTIHAAAVIDADVSTVTAAADKVVRVEDESGAWLLNLEAMSGHAGGIPERLHLKSVLLRQRHELPVHSLLVLLRREANASVVTGLYEQRMTDEVEPYATFRYQVLPVWTLPVQPLLAGDLGTLPLAALTDEAEATLPRVVQRIEQRIRSEANPEVGDRLRTATFLLLGLRYDDPVIEALYQEIVNMEDSSTYQAIIRKGEARGLERGREEGREEGRREGAKEARLEEARRFLLLLGEAKLGVPDQPTRAAVARIKSVRRLETLGRRLLSASNWQELLTPQ